ncbi:MAG: amino acid adenylation domain-containing protein [Bacteroidota bacterium]
MSKPSNLQKWLARKGGQGKNPGPDKRPDQQWAPLSNGQRQMWLLQELNPDNPFYHYAETYHLRGEIDAQLFIQAYGKIVERHEILRTVFQKHEGQWQQHIHSKPNFVSQYIDLSHSNSSKRKAGNLIVELAKVPFDLSEGPLSRIYLLKLTDHEHIALIVMHHIITDKWSMRLLRDELADYYQKLVRGELVELKPLPLQFGDYAFLKSKQPFPEAAINFWKEELHGAPSLLNIPTDRPPAEKPSYRGQFLAKTLTQAESRQIRQIAKDIDATLYQVFLAAFKIALYQRSGQNDILVGTPITNRDREELEHLIGYFNDTIIIRNYIDGNENLHGLIKSVKKSCLRAFAHKQASFEEVVKAVQPKRYPDRNPLFQHMFILHKVPPKPNFGQGLQLDYAPLDLGVAKFELTFYVSDDGDELDMLMEYATDLYEERTVSLLIDQIKSILLSEVKRIDDLPKLSQPEEAQINQWQAGQKFELENETVVIDLLRTAKSNPRAVAASFGEVQITYEQLLISSANLARELLAKGLQTGQLVGLHIDRSVEMIIGIWGILRAGGAYVPMDPEYPADRLQFMVDDADLTLIVGRELEVTNRSVGITYVHVDATPESDHSIELPDIFPSQPAYLIYTSGSSGKPKGVLVRHRELYFSTQARTRYYTENPHAFLLLSSFSFDSSVAGIFWTTTTGGQLVIAPRRIEQNLPALAEIIEQRQVTHTLLLPSLYSAILRFLPASQLNSIKAVIVAGEACPSKLISTHFEYLPQARLYNEYGPTEATVWCSVAELSLQNSTGEIPIGRPIPGSELFILDENGRQQPIGVPGELYVGGPGLTGGYWRRPDLTDDRFVDHPFSSGEKLYRTGDLTRWRHDGQIDFLGRADEQVKVRGYRIELGEIESIIRAYLASASTRDPTASDSVEGHVAVSLSNAGQLVTFIAQDFEENKLRKDLASRLPGYMVPAHYVRIEEIPHLPNGKIDRKSLPDHDLYRNTQATEVVDTNTFSPIQLKLLEIWREVLKVEQIGLEDNFFEIGGDSISSIQIVARAREADIHLAPTAIFEHQTIGQLALFAKRVDNQKKRSKSDAKVGPLLPIQEWFFEEHRQAPHYWNQAFEWSIAEKKTQQYWKKILPAEVQKHPILSVVFINQDGKKRMSILDDGQRELLEIWDFRNISPTDQEKEFQKRFVQLQDQASLEQSQVFKGILIERAEEQSDSLILMAHHLVVDAVSWSILLRDMELAFNRLRLGEELVKSEAEYVYFEWAEQLTEWLETDRFNGDLAFWQTQESVGFVKPAKAEIPSTEGRSETHTAVYKDARIGALKSEVHQAFNTNTEDLLLAALLLSFQRLWNQAQLCVQMEHNGRNSLDADTDFSSAVGWFTSSYPLLFDLAEKNDLGKKIRTVKETLRGVPNAGLSYGVLRYVNRNTALQQKPDLFFNYLGANAMSTNGNKRMLSSGVRHVDSERNRRLEVNLWLDGSELHAAWTFDSAVEEDSGLRDVIDAFPVKLMEIIDFCLSVENQQYSPSDFPDADLSQSELDDLLGQLDL